MDEEEEALLEEEEANTDSIIISPLTASKTTPQLQEIHQTPASNVGK